MTQVISSMVIPDIILRLSMRVAYWRGTLFWRYMLGSVGTGSYFYPRMHALELSRVWIGSNCEVRHNVTLDGRSEHRKAIVLGNGVRIKDSCALVAYGGFIHIGNSVLLGRCSTVFGHGGVTVGDHTMISPHVTIVSSNHVTTLADSSFQDQGFTREKITVEENVWIGANATILAGSHIEKNVVVGAGSVVNGRLREGYVYAGSPAQRIRPIPTSIDQETVVFKRDWGLTK